MGKVEQGDVVKLNAMFTALDTDAAGRVDVGMLVARADAARERLEKLVGPASSLPTRAAASGQRRASWRPTLLWSPPALKGRPTHAPDDGGGRSACPKALGEHTAPRRVHAHGAVPAAHTGAILPPPSLSVALEPYQAPCRLPPPHAARRHPMPPAASGPSSGCGGGRRGRGCRAQAIGPPRRTPYHRGAPPSCRPSFHALALPRRTLTRRPPAPTPARPTSSSQAAWSGLGLTPTLSPSLSLALALALALALTSSQAASTWGEAPPCATTCWAVPTTCTPPSDRSRPLPPPQRKQRCRCAAPHGTPRTRARGTTRPDSDPGPDPDH